MKRPYLFIFSACVLGELSGLKINKLLVLLILLILSLIIFKIRLRHCSKKIMFLSLIFIFIMQVFLLRIMVGDFYINNIKRYYIEEIKENNTVTISGIKGIKNVEKLKEKHIRTQLKIKKISIYDNGKNIEAGIFKFNVDNNLHADTLKAGDILLVEGIIKDINKATNNGEFDSTYEQKSKGIYYKLKIKNIKKVKESGYDALFSDMQKYFLDNLNTNIQDDTLIGLVRAITFGDKIALDKNMSETFSRHGISHLLAISGLHISLIGLFIYKILRKKLKFNFLISSLIAGIVLVFYQKILIRSISADRAIYMLLLVFIAENNGRNYDLLNSMGLIGTAILVINPYKLFTLGFILSFSAIIGIGVCNEYVIRPLKRTYNKFISHYLIQNLILSFFIQLISIPFIAVNFFYIPIYAPVLNLIVIPLFTVVCISAFILIFPGMPIISNIAVANIYYILKIYYILCGIIEKLYKYRLLIGRPHIMQIIVYYMCILLFLIFLKYYKNIRMKVFKILILIMPFLLIFVLIPIKNSKTELTFLDVGQGDGIYIKTVDKNILIDTGSTSKKDIGKNILKPFLLSKGIDRLDFAFITHADSDHYNGILYLIEEDKDIEIKEIVLPFVARVDENYEKIIKAAYDKNIKVSYIKIGDVIENKNSNLICLSPNEDVGTENTNRQSIVLMYEESDFKAVFCGDADISNENLILKNFDDDLLKDISLLKVGHHGSFTSTGEEFISHLRPLYAIISYGKENKYGHPSKEAVYNLNKYHVDIFETAKSGEITIITDGKNIKVKTFIK